MKWKFAKRMLRLAKIGYSDFSTFGHRVSPLVSDDVVEDGTYLDLEDTCALWPEISTNEMYFQVKVPIIIIHNTLHRQPKS